MPKLWSETIEAHRRDVRAAILDAAWALVAEHGLLSVTMSQIAERAGIGRATLYKYFPDVEAVLEAWHQRQVAAHLEHLAGLRDLPGEPSERLEAVLKTYAHMAQRRAAHGPELAAVLHRGQYVDQAHEQVHQLLKELLARAAEAGTVRRDVAPRELASYCMHALAAAGELRSDAAVRRLVAVTRTGLSSPP